MLLIARRFALAGSIKWFRGAKGKLPGGLGDAAKVNQILVQFA
jgi:hypothetical protein